MDSVDLSFILFFIFFYNQRRHSCWPFSMLLNFLSFLLSPFQTEENLMGMTSFREVLEKMLVIVVLPVRKSLRKEVELFSPHLVSNTCGLLASIVSELTASALGSEVKNKHRHEQACRHTPTDPSSNIVLCWGWEVIQLRYPPFTVHSIPPYLNLYGFLAILIFKVNKIKCSSNIHNI